MDIDKQQ